MKMSTWLAVCAVAVMFNADASARIGETLAECEIRYGKPVAKVPSPKQNFPESEAYRFKKTAFHILVVLVDGKVEIITYMKDTGLLALSEEEVQTLLKSNYPGEWGKENGAFASEDGKLMAQHDRL